MKSPESSTLLKQLKKYREGERQREKVSGSCPWTPKRMGRIEERRTEEEFRDWGESIFDQNEMMLRWMMVASTANYLVNKGAADT